MIKLYGSGQSRSFRGLWALEEANLDFEYIAVTRDMLASADYKALNFQGKIPTLVDDSLVLTESAAIVNYAASLSEHSLIPQSGLLRAEYDDLCFFIMTDLEQPLWTRGKHLFALPEEQRKEAVLETAVWEFAKSQTALQQRMGEREFAVGDQFSMADVLLAHTLGWAERFEMALAPELLAYRDKHFERPAFIASLNRVTN